MHFLKWVPIVGFCTVAFLPASAAADSHLVKIVNAGSGLCLY